MKDSRVECSVGCYTTGRSPSQKGFVARLAAMISINEPTSDVPGLPSLRLPSDPRRNWSAGAPAR